MKAPETGLAGELQLRVIDEFSPLFGVKGSAANETAINVRLLH